jgi:DNA-binding NtrC family response regulator/pSer/pThr/pTyr-binding forkhead associated (FHA) protein
MPELMFFRGGVEVLRVGLEQRRLVLGRSGLSDIVIPDPKVSRQHVALHFDGTRCTLEDLSGHGTVVAGKPMAVGELLDGVDLELGQWRAIYRQHGGGGFESPTSTSSRTEVQARATQAGRRVPFQVRLRHGPNESSCDLLPDSFTVGQSEENEVMIQDRFISGRHLQVTRCENRFRVRDLNSTNGTFLISTHGTFMGDGFRLIDAEVPMNTVLLMGETELIFEPVPEDPLAPPSHGIIGNDPAVRKLLELIGRVAPSTAGVLIMGESGTGKELVARALHSGSPRASQPFVTVNCAALSPALIESELFGHEKGAFTGAEAKRKGAFEEAHGGTLFLDEVGELPLELQAKLLRVLENGEIKHVGASRPFHVDVRVVAATNRNLWAEVRQGRFRQDVYYRLSVMPLHLPPLRERRGDIRMLAEHFVRIHTPRDQEVKFTSAALLKLQHHTWPGNIRELRSVVRRAMLLRANSKIEPGVIDFGQEHEHAMADAAGVPFELPEGLTLEQTLEQVERRVIENTLRRHDFHRDRTAKALGLSRSALFKRLKQWGYTQEDEEKN